MYLIAGLGNPGRRYRLTRHNVGFMLVDRLAEAAGAVCCREVGSSLLCRVDLAGHDVILAKPQTYMNLSGKALRELVDSYRVSLERCLIVYDEVALPLGSIRVRRAGSAGGHKGMSSILHHLGTCEVPRLRIGIAVDDSIEDLSRYVLDNFSRRERTVLEEGLAAAEAAVRVFISDGVEDAMARFN